MNTQPHYYLAGPMTGIAQFNIPAFRAATDLLRKAGMAIITPVELDSEKVYLAAMRSKDGKLDEHGKLAGETHADMLARDVKVIADQAAGVIVLPGWSKSRGAKLEVFVALLYRKPLYRYVGDHTPKSPLVAMSVFDAVSAIASSLLTADAEVTAKVTP